MGGDVKAQSAGSSNVIVFTSSVRLAARRVVFGRVDLRDASGEGRLCRRGSESSGAGYQWGESDFPVGIEAFVFSRKGREPSFYLGF